MMKGVFKMSSSNQKARAIQFRNMQSGSPILVLVPEHIFHGRRVHSAGWRIANVYSGTRLETGR